jgi:hypothetical protein
VLVACACACTVTQCNCCRIPCHRVPVACSASSALVTDLGVREGGNKLSAGFVCIQTFKTVPSTIHRLPHHQWRHAACSAGRASALPMSQQTRPRAATAPGSSTSGPLTVVIDHLSSSEGNEHPDNTAARGLHRASRGYLRHLPLHRYYKGFQSASYEGKNAHQPSHGTSWQPFQQ